MNPSSTPSKSTAGASDPEGFLDHIDSAVSALRGAHPDWFPCRPGCAGCCHRPFAITELDAGRLRRGLSLLDPARASAISQRAAEAWSCIREHFPGDAITGILTENFEWREWFFNRTTGIPCPVLDPASQSCLLYAHRPAACRLYGPLVRIGDTETTPCPLCYQQATPEQVRQSLVTIPIPAQSQGNTSETVIPAALGETAP